jgi:ribonucleoside-diphosphate reductase alpha chain
LGHAPAETDVKALEAKIGEKLEITARQVVSAAAAFETSLNELASAAALPVIKASPALEPAIQPLVQDLNAPPKAVRHRLPEERASVTHKFSIAGHEGYITVGLYPTGQPGEIFIKMAKEGSTVSGMMDSFATAISLALQHGVPLRVLCEKFAHTRFEPSGWTGNQQIGYAKSLMDYIFRWLNLRFLSGTQLSLFAGLAPQAQPLPTGPSLLAESEPEEQGGISQDQLARLANEVARKLNQGSGQSTPGVSNAAGAASGDATNPAAGPAARLGADQGVMGRGYTSAPSGGIAPEIQAAGAPLGSPTHGPELRDRGLYHASDAMRDLYDMGDAPSCGVCGAIMVRNGSCYRCMSCGSTSGCS